MASYINGMKMPEAVSDPSVYGSIANGMTRAQKIERFLRVDLPKLCDQNGQAENAVMNLSISLYYGLDANFTEQKVSRSLLTSSQASGITRARRLYASNNYLVRRQKGKWIAEPLLMQDDWLLQDNVHQAFEKIARAKAWHKDVEKPLLCDCTIDGWYKTVAWIARVKDGQKWHTLCCLPQNGLIVADCSEDEFPVLGDEKRIKVADCIFKLCRNGEEIVSLTQALSL